MDRRAFVRSAAGAPLAFPHPPGGEWPADVAAYQDGCGWVDVTQPSVGVVGDGSLGRNAEKIEAAIAAGFRRLYFPPGAYLLERTVGLARDGLAIRGAGAALTRFRRVAGAQPGEMVAMFITAPSGTGLDLSGFTLDGSDDPLHVQGIGVFGWREVVLRDLGARSIEMLSHFQGVRGFRIDGIAGREMVEGISLSQSSRGTVTRVVLDGCDEGIDFYDCEDVAVEHVHVVARSPRVIGPVAESQVGVDFSSCRRVTIAGSTFQGHTIGIKLKQEGPTGGALRPVEDVAITGCRILDFGVYGIKSEVEEGRGVRIEGNTIRSPGQPGEDRRGIGWAGARALEEVVIAGNTIEARYSALHLGGGRAIDIRDNLLRSWGWSAAHVEGVDGLALTGNRIQGNVAMPAVQIAGADDPSVESNQVTNPEGGGILVSNTRRPVIRGNTVRGVGYGGVYLHWRGTERLDARDRLLGFVVDGNVVSGWGQRTGNAAAVELRIEEIPAGAWSEGTLSSNRLLLDNSVSSTAQYGFAFYLPAGVSLQDVKSDANLVYGAAVDYANAGVLGPGSTRSGNTFKALLP